MQCRHADVGAADEHWLEHRERRGTTRAPDRHLDVAQHRLHYDVIANGVLWFLHHNLFDRIRRPRFDIHFRDAWAAYVAVNEAFTEAVAGEAKDHDIVLVQDYQLALVPGQLRERRPDLRVVHFTHTPFCGPDDISILPDDVGVDLCASLASGPAGFHTQRWADAYRRSAREVLGRGATITAPFAASLFPPFIPTCAATGSKVGTAGAPCDACPPTDAPCPSDFSDFSDFLVLYHFTLSIKLQNMQILQYINAIGIYNSLVSLLEKLIPFLFSN